MKSTLIIFNACMLILVILTLLCLGRQKSLQAATVVLGLPLVLGVAATFGALVSPVDVFGKIQLLTWAIFLHFPVYFAGAAFLSRGQSGSLMWVCVVTTIAILLVGLDAFLVEPHWLQISRVKIASEKMLEPVRIALIADLQTDRVGAYEERVLSLVSSEQPDLILLAGDYLHFYDRHEEYRSASADLNELMHNVGLEAPLGAYAVRGNVDRQDWTRLFTGLPVTTIDSTARFDLGSVKLTALSFEDSANSNLVMTGADAFHIVLGHVPNFSLGEVQADLLVAGHTHGGQVQLPFLGPVFTLSSVPRSWAAGVTEIAPGKTLIVSRGIGMERVNAPRLRFLCRPELVIIDLVPLD